MAKMKLVGTVTTEEKNEIQQLFERRNELNEKIHYSNRKFEKHLLSVV